MSTAIRLHVGCGGDIRPGYVNIDAHDPRADRKLRLEDLDYPDSSVEVIEGYMVIEHLTPAAAGDFVRNARRMLVSGGRLVLECPDILKVSRLCLLFAADVERTESGAFGLRGFFGEPTSHMTSGDFHKWGYTPATMERLLLGAGFASVAMDDGVSHGYPLRDMRATATK